MTSENQTNNVSDEVLAAEAELRSAQETLEAARARLAELKGEHPAVFAADDPVAATSDGTCSQPTPAQVQESEHSQGSRELQGSGQAEETAKIEQTQASTQSEKVQKGQEEQPAQDTQQKQQTPKVEQPQQSQQAAQSQQSPQSQTSQQVSQHQPPQQPQQPYADYAAPYGQVPPAGFGGAPYQQPYYGYPYSSYQQPYPQPLIATKDHVAAGLLAIFLGALGIHKFYLGYNTPGFIMLAVTVLGSLFTFGLAGLVMGVISMVEGIVYLTKSQSVFDQTYVAAKREWF